MQNYSLNVDIDYSICENNGTIIENTQNLTSSFPVVHIITDHLRLVSSSETAQSAFLQQEKTLANKLHLAWQGQGVVGILNELNSDEEKVSPLIRSFAKYLSIGLKWIRGMHFTLFPHLKMSHEELVSAYSKNLAWNDAAIRYLAWHPKAEKFALALKNDTIQIRYLNNVLVPVLKHKQQHMISCMAWKPFCASILAVATNSGILLWNIDPNSLSTRPSTGAVQVLSYNGHSPVTSLAWSPFGDDFLLAVSPLSSAIVAWSTTLKQYQVIHHITSGISSLLWSPDGSKVLAATPTKSFRVFETKLWSNELWSNLEERMKCACWNPEGTVLIFSMLGDSKVLSLTFCDSAQSDDYKLDGAQNASLALDLTQMTNLDESNDVVENENNGIEAMAWDSTGTWLAISFGSDIVYMYSTSSNPVLTIAPRGQIRSNDESSVVFMEFKPSMQNGACLTLCWSNGKVNYIPLIGHTGVRRLSPKTVPQMNQSNLLFSSM